MNKKQVLMVKEILEGIQTAKGVAKAAAQEGDMLGYKEAMEHVMNLEVCLVGEVQKLITEAELEAA